MHPKKKRGHHRDHDSYVCPKCGETIETALDRSAGDEQEYVEDCPVCCRPWDVRVTYLADGSASVELRAEDDS